MHGGGGFSDASLVAGYGDYQGSTPECLHTQTLERLHVYKFEYTRVQKEKQGAAHCAYKNDQG
jgi:hypothetical protein